MSYMSLPFSFISKEVGHRIVDMVAKFSARTARSMLYNLDQDPALMGLHWSGVQRYTTMRVHYGIPPEFTVDVGSCPIHNPEKGPLNGTTQSTNGVPVRPKRFKELKPQNAQGREYTR